MRLTILAAALLLLTGCYESSEMLLDPAAARQPITASRDWTYGNPAHRTHARLSAKPNGWYDYAEARLDASGAEGPWKSYAVLLNSLTQANGYQLFVYATYNKDDRAYMYGVVAVGSDGFWQTVIPNCDGVNADPKWLKADIAAAKAAGANLKNVDDAEDVCHFTNRAQLFAAMRNVVAAPGFWARVQAARS